MISLRNSFDKCLDVINQFTFYMKVDLHLLTAFLQVVDCGGFSAAARHHGLSQPSLSRQILQLEGRLGQRVFDRDTRNIRLTAVGKELQVLARRLLGDLEQSLDRLTALAGGSTGRVVVAAIPTLSATLIPAAIRKFTESNPGVVVELRDGLTQSVMAAVTEDLAEIGLTVRPPPNRDFTFRPLLQDRFVAASPPAFGIDEGEIDWSALSQWPFIAFHKNSSIRMVTETAFAQVNSAFVPQYECRELTTVGGLLAAGLGVAALPQLALPLLSADVDINSLTSPPMSRVLGILTSSRRSLSPAAQALQKCLVTQARLSEFAYVGAQV